MLSDITVLGGSFVFSQSCVHVSDSLTSTGSQYTCVCTLLSVCRSWSLVCVQSVLCSEAFLTVSPELAVSTLVSVHCSLSVVLGGSFVFSQSCVQVSASLCNVSCLPVSTFTSVHRSVSVVRFVFVLDVGQYVSQSKLVNCIKEIEENGKVPFLDCLVIRDNNKLRTTVYRKPSGCC